MPQFLAAILDKLVASRTGGDILFILVVSTMVISVSFAAASVTGYGFASVAQVSQLEAEVKHIKVSVGDAIKQIDKLANQSLTQNIFNTTTAMCKTEIGTRARSELASRVATLREEYAQSNDGQSYPPLSCDDIK